MKSKYVIDMYCIDVLSERDEDLQTVFFKIQ